MCVCVRACVCVFSHASVHGRTFTSARARSHPLHSPPPFSFLVYPSRSASIDFLFNLLFSSFFQARQAQKWAPLTRGTAPRIWRASWGRRKRVVTTQIKSKQREEKNQSSHFVRILEQIETCGSPPYQTKKEKQSLHTFTAK